MSLAVFKGILTLLVALFLVNVVGANNYANPDPGLVVETGCDLPVQSFRIWGSELCFTHGVTAALFALATAALLFIALIPRRTGAADGLSEALHRLVSSVAAAGAGAYWLKSEAGEAAWVYVAVILFLGGIVIVSAALPVAVLFPLNSLMGWVSRRISAGRATRLLVKSHLEEHAVFERKLARLEKLLLLLPLLGVVAVVVLWILSRITRRRSSLGKS